MNDTIDPGRYGPNTPQVVWMIQQLRQLSPDQWEHLASWHLSISRPHLYEEILHRLAQATLRAGPRAEEARTAAANAGDDVGKTVPQGLYQNIAERSGQKYADAVRLGWSQAILQGAVALALRNLLHPKAFEGAWGALEFELNLLGGEQGLTLEEARRRLRRGR